MDRTTQYLAWRVLPAEFKEEVKRLYRIADSDVDQMIAMIMLENVFGHHNLTSDAEGEELLTCEKYKVEEALNYCDELDSISGSHNMLNWGKQMIAYLFGSKCLLDEDAHEDNFVSIEPKPAEPKEKSSNSTELKSQEVDKHFDAIIKDGFREHNRLHIASILMSGLLASGKEKHPVRRAMDLADALIAGRDKEGGEE